MLSEEDRNLLLAAAALSSREFTDPVFQLPERSPAPIETKLYQRLLCQ